MSNHFNRFRPLSGTHAPEVEVAQELTYIWGTVMIKVETNTDRENKTQPTTLERPKLMTMTIRARWKTNLKRAGKSVLLEESVTYIDKRDLGAQIHKELLAWYVTFAINVD